MKYGDLENHYLSSMLINLKMTLKLDVDLWIVAEKERKERTDRKRLGVLSFSLLSGLIMKTLSSSWLYIITTYIHIHKHAHKCIYTTHIIFFIKFYKYNELWYLTFSLNIEFPRYIWDLYKSSSWIITAKYKYRNIPKFICLFF